jgi:drug/metabolite transporter (DMT)-like permease
MLIGVVVGILLAAVAMVLYSGGALLQAEGTRRATRRRPVAIQPRYLIGLSLDFAAWLCAAGALRVLPVFAVQAVVGGTIALTAVAGAWLAGARMPMVMRLAVAGCLAGLVLVAASAGPEQPPARQQGVDLILLVALLLLAVAVLVLRTGKRAWPLAAVSGVGFGSIALSIRAAHVQTGDSLDPVLLITQPATYLVVGFWVVGMIGHVAALGRGDVGAVTAVYTVAQVLVPGLVGILLLGDAVRPGWLWVLVLGLAGALASSVLIARHPPLRPPRVK